jgi:hypothetical protein
MLYCVNAQKTTIDYFNKEGERKKFITAQGGVDVECIDSPRTGKYIFTVQDGGYNLDCSPQHQITYYTNTFIADSYTVSGGISPYPNLTACSWTKLTFFIGDDISTTQNFPSAYQIAQVNNPDYSPGGKALIIKDSLGNQLFKANARDCNFIVNCNDECPEGSHKCTHNKYPGYCCVPCEETGDKLKNIASTVGR